MKSLVLTISTASIIILGVGCSDDDGSSRPRSASDVVAAIESPTGTVTPETVQAIAQHFERGLTVEPQETKNKARGSFDVNAECLDGGDASASGALDEAHGELNISFDNCCLGPCCKTGTFSAFSDRKDLSYAGCISYDFSTTCGSSDLHIEGEGCIDLKGLPVRVLTVDGETFTVSASGSFQHTQGELNIQGANGSFTCTFKVDGSGSCSGDAEFDF